MEAKEKGLRTFNGLQMLVNQGAIAFELWTGEPAPVDVMREAMEKSMVWNFLEKVRKNT